MGGPSFASTQLIDLTADSDGDEVMVDAGIDKRPAAEYDTCFGLVRTP